MRVTILIIVLIAVPHITWASLGSTYIAQAVAGADTGADCNNAHAATFFNTAANWGAGAAQIGAGTIVHLCGTFTGTLNSTMLTAQGSGASGNPVTLLFETNANFTSPAWNSPNGAINIGGRNFITIDGGTNGIIQNTANGTNLANKITSRGVNAGGCSNCTVKNLTIANLYVHVGVADTAADQANMNCITYVNTANITINNVTCHDAGWALNGYGNNLTVTNSELFNVDHGLAIITGPNGITGMDIHGNHIHDYTNWDTTTNAYHHDGIHCQADPASSGITGTIYNNTFDGNPGVNITGHIFFEQNIINTTVYNNVVINGGTHDMTALWLGGSGISVYNNYIQGGPMNNSGVAMKFSTSTNLTFKNNVVKGGNVVMLIFQSSTLAASGANSSVDFNLYENVNADGGSLNSFGWQGTNTTSFTSWKTSCNCDSHSLMQTSSQMLVDSSGHLQTSSPAIGLGTNLTSLGIIPLDSDKAGASRPASGAWDAGAYQFVSGGCSPSVTGLTLNPSTVTSGNISTGTVTVSCAVSVDTAVSLSSSDPSSASTPSSCTVTTSSTNCTFTITTYTVPVTTVVTFTATLGGSITAQLTVNPPPAGGTGQGGGSKVSGSAKVG